MLYDNSYLEIDTDPFLLFGLRKKVPNVRKWREIEALKARQQLSKELYELDPSFKLSSIDFL